MSSYSNRGRGGFKRRQESHDYQGNSKNHRGNDHGPTIQISKKEWLDMQNAVIACYTVLNKMQNIKEAITSTEELNIPMFKLKEAVMSDAREVYEALPNFKPKGGFHDIISAKLESQQKQNLEMQERSLKMQEQMLQESQRNREIQQQQMQAIQGLRMNQEQVAKQGSQETRAILDATKQVYQTIVPGVGQQQNVVNTPPVRGRPPVRGAPPAGQKNDMQN